MGTVTLTEHKPTDEAQRSENEVSQAVGWASAPARFRTLRYG